MKLGGGGGESHSLPTSSFSFSIICRNVKKNATLHSNVVVPLIQLFLTSADRSNPNKDKENVMWEEE